MATSVPLGIVSLKAEGAYSADKLYKKGMWVTSSGSSYAYIHPTPAAGVPVTDTSHWQQIAKKGDTGPKGDPGEVSQAQMDAAIIAAVDPVASQLAEKANKIDGPASQNLITQSFGWIPQYFYKQTTGVLQSSQYTTNYFSSRKISIAGGAKHKTQYSYGLLYFWDANEQYISSVNINAGAGDGYNYLANKIFTAPHNAAYMAFSVNNESYLPNYLYQVDDMILIPGLSIGINNIDATSAKLLLPLYGKTVVNLGDSIFGLYHTDDVSSFIAQRTGATVYNCGFGGTFASSRDGDFGKFSLHKLVDAIIAEDFSEQDATGLVNPNNSGAYRDHIALSLNTLKGIYWDDVDIVTIAYGTNDWYTGKKLIENEEDSDDDAYFNGALRYSINALLTAYPHLKIVLLTPIWRYFIDGDNQYVDDSDTHVVTESDLKLTAFVDAVKTLGKEYKILTIDNYHKLGINCLNRERYILANDGTHLNILGRELLGNRIGAVLNSSF